MPGAALPGTATNIEALVDVDDRELEGTADHPDGTDAVRVMVPLNPAIGKKETVELDEFPAEIVSGEAERTNPGPERVSIRPAPFGLPQPVARSYPVVAE